MLNGKNYTDSVLIIFKQNKILTNILLSWASTIQQQVPKQESVVCIGSLKFQPCNYHVILNSEWQNGTSRRFSDNVISDILLC